MQSDGNRLGQHGQVSCQVRSRVDPIRWRHHEFGEATWTVNPDQLQSTARIVVTPPTGKALAARDHWLDDDRRTEARS